MALCRKGAFVLGSLRLSRGSLVEPANSWECGKHPLQWCQGGSSCVMEVVGDSGGNGVVAADGCCAWQGRVQDSPAPSVLVTNQGG